MRVLGARGLLGFMLVRAHRGNVFVECGEISVLHPTKRVGMSALFSGKDERTEEASSAIVIIQRFYDVLES